MNLFLKLNSALLSGLGVGELAVAVLQKLLIRSEDGATQADLVDLCGIGCSDTITEIITNRDELLKSYQVISLLFVVKYSVMFFSAHPTTPPPPNMFNALWIQTPDVVSLQICKHWFHNCTFPPTTPTPSLREEGLPLYIKKVCKI